MLCESFFCLSHCLIFFFFDKEQFRVSEGIFSPVVLFNICARVALPVISTTVVKYLQKSGSSYEFNRERAPKINQSAEHIFIGFYDQIHNSS